jgi:hypothetical protein
MASTELVQNRKSGKAVSRYGIFEYFRYSFTDRSKAELTQVKKKGLTYDSIEE